MKLTPRLELRLEPCEVDALKFNQCYTNAVRRMEENRRAESAGPAEHQERADDAGCSRATAVPVLNAAFERGEIQRQGRGVKGDPYTYNRYNTEKSFPSAPNPGAVTETENPNPSEDWVERELQQLEALST